jgi:signal transduction histidine kinase
MKELISAADFKPDALLAQVDSVRTAASRLSDMVGELLNEALTDAMDISLRKEVVDFNSLVREVIEANLVLAQRKNQTIAAAVAVDPLPVHADPDRLREAVDNLISNAVKYSPFDGHIEVSLGAGTDDVTFEVRDRGPGLLPDDMRRLFGRFQRLSASPTGGEPSTGLGLFITKKIVDLHGGGLSAHSDGAGAGSTFRVRLPIHRGTRP